MNIRQSPCLDSLEKIILREKKSLPEFEVSTNQRLIWFTSFESFLFFNELLVSGAFSLFILIFYTSRIFKMIYEIMKPVRLRNFSYILIAVSWIFSVFKKRSKFCLVAFTLLVSIFGETDLIAKSERAKENDLFSIEKSKLDFV